MTEKEKTLELMIKHFMAKAEEMRKSKDQMVMVNASQGHWAAIEVAGLGAATETIDWAVKEYLKKSKHWLFGHDDFSLAIAMTLKGASKEVAEEMMVVAVKYYSWIWPLEKLTAYLEREPTEEEIFSIVEVERAHTAVLAEDYHKKLVQFAGKHLPSDKVRRIKDVLREKTREFNSHSD